MSAGNHHGRAQSKVMGKISRQENPGGIGKRQKAVERLPQPQRSKQQRHALTSRSVNVRRRREEAERE